MAAKLNHLALNSLCTLICSTSPQRQLRQYNLLSALPVLRRQRPNRKLPLRRLGGSSLSPYSYRQLRAEPSTSLHPTTVLFCWTHRTRYLTSFPGAAGQLQPRGSNSFLQQKEIFFSLAAAIKLDICYCHNGKSLLEIVAFLGWWHP